MKVGYLRKKIFVKKEKKRRHCVYFVLSQTYANLITCKKLFNIETFNIIYARYGYFMYPISYDGYTADNQPAVLNLSF